MAHRLTSHRISRLDHGFTLVELAICLMVIGILMGGILKGRELIENARINKLAHQLKAYDEAVLLFYSTYSALPGDILDPAKRISDCTATPCSTTGNGDNGILLTSGWKGNSGWGGTSNEQYNFWLHMAKAGMINGINLSWTSFTTTPGVDIPELPIAEDSSLIVKSWGAPYEQGNIVYLWIAPTSMFGGGAVMNGHWQNFSLSGQQAAQLDQKIDNGNPNTGIITATGNYPSQGAICVNGSEYYETQKVKTCDVLYRFILPTNQ